MDGIFQKSDPNLLRVQGLTLSSANLAGGGGYLGDGVRPIPERD